MSMRSTCGSAAGQRDGGLGGAPVDHGCHVRQRREPLDERGRVVGLRPGGPGRRSSRAGGGTSRPARPVRTPGRPSRCATSSSTISRASWRRSRRSRDSSPAIPSRISCSVRAERPRRPRSRPDRRRVAQLLQRRDPERRVQLADRLRAEARDAEEVEERGRELGEEALVVPETAGLCELGELVGDRPPDARDLRRAALAVRPRDLDRRSPDGIRRAVIGHRLEDELALDLEEVADLVEDPVPARRSRAAPARRRRGGPRAGRIGRVRASPDGSQVSSARTSGPAGGACRPAGGSPGVSCDQPAITRSRPARLARRSAWSARSTIEGIGSSRAAGVRDPDGDGDARHAVPAQVQVVDGLPDALPHLDRDVGTRACGAGRQTPRHRRAPARPPRGRQSRSRRRRPSGPRHRPDGRSVSLRTLNLSISTIRTATASPARRRRASSPQNSSK